MLNNLSIVHSALFEADWFYGNLVAMLVMVRAYWVESSARLKPLCARLNLSLIANLDTSDLW